jgi:hypothetical protein
MNTRSGLAACGVIAVLAIAGCGSSGSSAAGGTAGAGGTATASGTAAANGSGSTQPSWAGALGSGVMAVAPASVSAGQGSPGAVATGLVDAVAAGKIAQECPYFQSAAAAKCKSAAASGSTVANSTVKNYKLGYVAIDGKKALVGTEGTFCSPDQTPKCFTNTDPAAKFSSGKSFSTLWKDANNVSGNVYSLLPCIEVGGKWYAYSPS